MSRDPLAAADLAGDTSGVVVFACGDPLRGDDSVAIQACTSLPSETNAHAEVKLIGAIDPGSVRDVPIGVRVVIVDAVVGAAPGEIVEMDLAELDGRAQTLVTTSTHQLPLNQVVAIGQLLRGEPLLGRFVGVGIENVEIGAGPTPNVESAIPLLRAAVAAAVVELAAT